VPAKKSVVERCAIAEMTTAGQTAVVLAVDAQAAAVIGIADAPRHTSAAAVPALAGAGVEVVMLTGDNQATARRIAAELGVGTVIADVDKAARSPPSRDAGGSWRW
jgi:P-type Cu2+ transporter